MSSFVNSFGGGGTGVQGPAGPTGTIGATGAQGPGVSGPFVRNSGATLGQFQNLNFAGNIVGQTAAGSTVNITTTGIASGIAFNNAAAAAAGGISLGAFQNIILRGSLLGTTGPGTNTVTINSLNDILQMGVTGYTGGYISSGFNHVAFNNPITTGGNALTYTTVGTQAGFIRVGKGGTYEISYAIAATGPNNVGNTFAIQQKLNATGLGLNGPGSGTPIAQSVGYLQYQASGFAAWTTKDYAVFIPTGSSIETFITYSDGPGASPTGIFVQQTGTNFHMRLIG